MKKVIKTKLSLNGVRVNEVTVEGKGVYRWNPVYCTYNSIEDNSLLMDLDIKNIISWLERINPSESETMNIVHRIQCKMMDLQAVIKATKAAMEVLSDKISTHGDHRDSEDIDVYEQNLNTYKAQLKVLEEILNN